MTATAPETGEEVSVVALVVIATALAAREVTATAPATRDVTATATETKEVIATAPSQGIGGKLRQKAEELLGKSGSGNNNY